MLRFLLIALAILAGVSVVSCRVRRVVVVHDAEHSSGPRDEVIVTEEAPAAQVEVIPVAPSPSHVWITGYWTHHGGSWVWVGGRYVVRPHAHAVWVPGRWERHRRGWVWVHGRWA